jgi:hypothetical protein
VVLDHYTDLTKHEVVGHLLQSGVMSYMAMTHIQNQLSAQTSDIVYYREPSYGTFSTNARIQYLFNQPQSIEMTGLLMDMDRMKSSAECKNNCWENWRDFNQQTGAAMSAYEHLIPEQLFSSDEEPIEGISAVKALAIATQQGQRIYTITNDNLNTALQALTFDDDAVKQEIRSQVTAGLVVTVHRDELTYAGWSGVGYTVIDPETGAGAYKISGGSDGAEMSSAELSDFGSQIGLLAIVTGVAKSFLKVNPYIGIVLLVIELVVAVQLGQAATSNCQNSYSTIIGLLVTMFNIASIGAIAVAITAPLSLHFIMAALMVLVMTSVFSNMVVSSTPICRE